MSIKTYRWLGISLIVVAVAVLVVTTRVLDVPGPMEPSKPEFTYEFSTPFAILSALLGLSGIVLVTLGFRRKA